MTQLAVRACAKAGWNGTKPKADGSPISCFLGCSNGLNLAFPEADRHCVATAAVHHITTYILLPPSILVTSLHQTLLRTERLFTVNVRNENAIIETVGDAIDLLPQPNCLALDCLPSRFFTWDNTDPFCGSSSQRHRLIVPMGLHSPAAASIGVQAGPGLCGCGAPPALTPLPRARRPPMRMPSLGARTPPTRTPPGT
jgi:hypothetical protein